jgi:citrate lyase beta subunit
MELKDFVKKVIIDLDKAVSEANAETQREIRFKGVRETRTALEFDVAVTVESSKTVGGKGEIRVLAIAEAGVEGVVQSKSSTVSRVSFGVDVSEYTKEERRQQMPQPSSQPKKARGALR